MGWTSVLQKQCSTNLRKKQAPIFIAQNQAAATAAATSSAVNGMRLRQSFNSNMTNCSTVQWQRFAMSHMLVAISLKSGLSHSNVMSIFSSFVLVVYSRASHSLPQICSRTALANPVILRQSSFVVLGVRETNTHRRSRSNPSTAGGRVISLVLKNGLGIGHRGSTELAEVLGCNRFAGEIVVYPILWKIPDFQ
jgi:hypothetical protein